LFLRSSLAALLALAVSPSLAAPILWRGDAQVTTVVESAAGACKSSWFPGMFFTVLFQPKGVAGNGANDQFTLVSPINAWQFTVTNPTYPTPTADLHYITKFGGFAATSGAQLSGFAISPNPVLATTTNVVVRFTVPNVFGNVGCRASFAGLLQRSLP
jgi:hypothetical protein